MAGDKKLTVTLLGDAKQLMSTLGDAGSKLGDFGAKASAGLAIGGAAAVAAGAAVGGALFKLGSSFDDAYDKMQVATGATGLALDTLKDDFKEVVKAVPTDFGKASDALADLAQRTGVMGPDLQDLAKQSLELSRITGTDLKGNIEATQDAFNAWGVEVGKQIGLNDELFRASQSTGQSVASIASSIGAAQPQLKALGFDFETSAALAATLGQAGSSLEDVMPAMGKAMAQAAKDGKPAKQVFDETFKAIKAAPDSTKAAGAALEVFGAKAGPKLAEMIRSGKLSYDDLLKSMKNGSNTIVGVGADTQDFAEKWQLIKNRVLVALEPLAMKVFDGVGKAMDKLGPYVDRAAAWFSKNLPVALAYLEPKAKAVFGWLQQHVPPILEALRAAAVRTFEWIRVNVPPVLDAVATFVRTKVIPALDRLGGWVRDNLLPALEKLWKSFRENILPVLRDVAEFIATKVLPVLADIGLWIAEHVLPWVGKLVTFILGDLIPAFFKVVNYIVEKLLPKIADVGKWFKDHIIDPGADVVSWFSDLPGKIEGFFSGLGETITAPFRTAFAAVAALWNNTLGKISFTVPDWVPFVGGNSWSFPTINLGNIGSAPSRTNNGSANAVEHSLGGTYGLSALGAAPTTLLQPVTVQNVIGGTVVTRSLMLEISNQADAQGGWRVRTVPA